MLDDWVDGGRQPDRDAARHAARRPARPHRRRRRRSPTATSRSTRRSAPGRRHRRPDDPVPRHRRPLHAERRDRRSPRSTRTRRTATANPAVTLRSVGANGGQAAAFTYDLARSVVYTRQGNPAWAGQERDGEPARSAPTTCSSAAQAGDPQPDWVDLDKVAIPQADEQQRLLANLIAQMNADRKPLPRFWYLPRGEKAAVVMTGDDHAQRRHRRPLRPVQGAAARPAARSPTGSACARTSYIYPNTPLTDAAGGRLPGRRASRSRCTSTPTAPTARRRQLDAVLRRPARRLRARTIPASRRRPPTAPTASSGATGPRSRRSSSTTASASTPTTTTGRRRWVAGPARACSPARACRCASPTSTAR